MTKIQRFRHLSSWTAEYCSWNGIQAKNGEPVGDRFTHRHDNSARCSRALGRAQKHQRDNEAKRSLSLLRNPIVEEGTLGARESHANRHRLSAGIRVSRSTGSWQTLRVNYVQVSLANPSTARILLSRRRSRRRETFIITGKADRQSGNFVAPPCLMNRPRTEENEARQARGNETRRRREETGQDAGRKREKRPRRITNPRRR